MKRAPGWSPAFVLHRYDWSESSLVLELFTRDLGRLAAVAKGAKRPTSQLRAVLLPFQHVQIALTRPSRDAEQDPDSVRTLRSAEWVGGLTLPRGAALMAGFYLNELLLRLLPRLEPHPQVFDRYADTLAALHDVEDAPTHAALRAFEWQLLHRLGWLPDLSLATATQQPLQSQARYGISPRDGVVLASGGEPAALTGDALVHLEAALRHGHPDALRSICLRETAQMPAMKSVLRALLQYHLGPQGLRTRAVWREAQNHAAGA